MILNNSLPELEQLDELYENGDYESVRIKVHKAKSAMGYVGAQQTRQLLLEIEKGVKEVYPEKNAQLKSELEIVRQEVQQFISEI
ncbi:Hpt domain-containing protein [Echinicola pacifica]|nr:Hpt domain-containing protein [Echinicola pacifica]